MTSVAQAGVSNGFANLVDLLRDRAERYADKIAYRVLRDDDSADELTYRELLSKTLRLAASIQRRTKPGDRAILLSPNSLETIVGYFGSIAAGTMAVPVPMPRANHASSRLRNVLEDAAPAVVLATSSVAATAAQRLAKNPELLALPWLSIEDGIAEANDDWRDPKADPESLAFLQYTSGSTAYPKGVMISHRNVLANSAMIQEWFSNSDQTQIVSWVPIFHDMGLIGSIVHAVWLGGTCTLMPPASFMLRPFRWLQAISKYRGSFCGGPDFSLELCVRKTTPQEREQLDLSCWTGCYSGAEPVQAKTIERFTEAFAVSGFRREWFCASYGMAESVVGVSVGRQHTASPTFDPAALEMGLAVDAKPGDRGAMPLVANGWTGADHRLEIVDAKTCLPCPPGVIGEIWFAGPSVARGYWNKPDATKETFAGYIANTNDGPFLRTGDLGFVRDGSLFIVARVKDLIILQGRNLHPSDLEISVVHAHANFRPGGTAAFSVSGSGREKLVVLQEVERGFPKEDADDAIVAIRRAIAGDHEVEASCIVLLKPTSLPRTTSGKVQRGQCREVFLSNQLDVLCRWDLVDNDESAEPVEDVSESGPRTAVAILSWFVHDVSQRLKVDPKHIDVNVPFASLGLSSREIVAMVGRAQKWLGRPLSPTLVYNHPTMESLAAFLADDCDQDFKISSAMAEANDVAALNDKELEDYLSAEIAKLQQIAESK